MSDPLSPEEAEFVAEQIRARQAEPETPERPAPPETGGVPEAGAGESSEGGDGSPVADSEDAPATGPALARAVLDAARTRRSPPRRRSEPRGDPDSLRAARGASWSGPGADRRDPQAFGAVLSQLMRARGWELPAAEARLFAVWERVVGAEIADHCRPVKLEGGELTIEAKSTAWATQLRLLAASLLRKIAAEVGHNVVTKLHIHGPAAPSWNRGPRRVRGRGPRDTYG